jgi:pilus assembly protein Flp/PilA
MVVHASVTNRKQACASPSTREGETTMNLMNRMRALVRDDSGQDMLEYALLTALIALAAVGAVRAAGVEVNEIFGEIEDDLANR